MTQLVSALDPDKPVYRGRELLLAPEFLGADGCSELMAYADRVGGKPAPVGDTRADGLVGNRQDTAFTADRIDMADDPHITERSIAMCRHIYGNCVAPYYGVDIEWFEVPHILRYSRGGNYLVHSDCENWDDGQQRWIKGVDRDFSSIVYLNADFTGGTLAFPALNLRVHPQPGLLVTFPSDHRFRHAAEITVEGTRYAFVTWAVRTGSPRVMKTLPPFIVRMDQQT